MNPWELVKWERQSQLQVKWCLLDRYVKVAVTIAVKVILIGRCHQVKTRYGESKPNGRCLYKMRPFGFQDLDSERKTADHD